LATGRHESGRESIVLGRLACVFDEKKRIHDVNFLNFEPPLMEVISDNGKDELGKDAQERPIFIEFFVDKLAPRITPVCPRQERASA